VIVSKFKLHNSFNKEDNKGKIIKILITQYHKSRKDAELIANDLIKKLKGNETLEEAVQDRIIELDSEPHFELSERVKSRVRVRGGVKK